MRRKEKFVHIALGAVLVMVVLLGMASITWAEGYGWTTKADMPTARSALSTSMVDGKIYAIGGIYGGKTTVEVYDPTTDTWTQKADMPTARWGLSTGVVDGKIYAIGGAGPASQTLRTVEEYDPATDTWTQKAQMPTGRQALSTSVVDGKIYAIGGQAWMEKQTFRAVEEYDPATDAWTQKTDMLGIRVALSTSVVDGKIYAIGGSTGLWPWPPVSTVEVYDPAIGMEMERLSEGLISVTETLGATWVGQATPLEIAVEFEVPLESTESLRHMSLDLSPLGISSDLPLEHAGEGRYTVSTTITPLRNGHYDLPVLVETTEGKRYRFLTVTLDVYPGGDEYLYQDQMGSRWEAEVSSAGTLDLTGSDVVHWGSHAQAITLQSAGHVTFEAPEGFSTFGYTGFEFWIHPGTSSMEKAWFALSTPDGTKYLKFRDLALQPNVWQMVSIPLEDLELVDTHLKKIQLRGMEGTFYIDDLAFVVAEYGLEEAVATPEKVKADGTMPTVLTVQAVPGVPQPGAPPTVTIDLRPIGGEEDAGMVDDGTGGDQAAGDGIYTLQTTVDPEIQNGRKDLVVTSVDSRLRLVRTPLSVGVLPVEDAVLYQDGVEAGWKLGLSSVETNPTSAEYVHSGTYACAVTFRTGAQMDYIVEDADGLPTFGYMLEFWIHPGEATIEELKIVAFRVGGGVKVLPLVEQLGLSFEAETWQLVSIPVEALELTDANLERIRFVGNVQGTFYIDDMRFVPEEVEIPTAVEEVSEATALPLGYSLAQNYPNPFNPLTAIAYNLPEASHVTLTLYTITGQKVAVLVDGRQDAGHYQVMWDGSRFASGIYFYRLKAGQIVQTRRMVLLK